MRYSRSAAGAPITRVEGCRDECSGRTTALWAARGPGRLASCAFAICVVEVLLRGRAKRSHEGRIVPAVSGSPSDEIVPESPLKAAFVDGVSGQYAPRACDGQSILPLQCAR